MPALHLVIKKNNYGCMKGIFQMILTLDMFLWVYGAPTQYMSYSAEHTYESVNQIGNKSGMKHMLVWMGTLGAVQLSFMIC